MIDEDERMIRISRSPRRRRDREIFQRVPTSNRNNPGGRGGGGGGDGGRGGAVMFSNALPRVR